MPEEIYVLFSDETHSVVIANFGAPQDPAVYPNYGTLMTDDERWHTYYYSAPEWLRFYMPTPV